jgi:hypothetical protein
MSKRYSQIGKNIIEWDQTYYITYAGGKRELPAKDQKEYDKTLNLPFALQRQELKKLGFEKNPNVVPIKGLSLIELFKDRSFIPFFDEYFNQSHLIQIHDQIVYESIKQKSYDLLLNI